MESLNILKSYEPIRFAKANKFLEKEELIIKPYEFYGQMIHGIDKILHKGIKAIGEYAFAETNIKTIIIPNSVEVIGKYAFKNCKNLKKIIINKNKSKLRVIKEGAFLGCKRVELLQLPGNKIRIEFDALNFNSSTDNHHWKRTDAYNFLGLSEEEKEENWKKVINKMYI